MTRSPVALVVLATVACSTPVAEPSVTRRDSAGIEIVESRSPSTPGRLSIDTVGVVDIGGGSGTPHAEFLGSVTAVRLQGGDVAIAGWTATELRFFDSAGTWIRNVGRAGAGPGEFLGLGFVFAADGGLMTFEPSSRRVQYFAGDGAYQGFAVLAASPDAGYPNVIGTLPGRTLLVTTGNAVDSGGGGPLVSNRQSYYRTEPTAGRHVRLFETPGPVHIRHPRRPQYRIGTLPYAWAPSVAVVGSQVVNAMSKGFGVDVRDSTGRILRSLRREWLSEPVTSADRERAAAEATTTMDSTMRDEVRKVIAGAGFPDHRPAVAAIASSPDGRIFVQHFGTPFRPSRELTVFAADGGWEQELTLPREVRLLQAGAGFIVGAYPDDDEFQHVVVYRLRSAKR